METPVSTSEEVQETTINDLFDKDPELITDPEISAVVAYMRAGREKWEKEDLEKSRSGGRTRKSTQTTEKDSGKIKLSSIDLDIEL